MTEKEVAQEVRGMKWMGRMRKGSDWYNEELERERESWLENKTAENRREQPRFLQCRNRLKREGFRMQKDV